MNNEKSITSVLSQGGFWMINKSIARYFKDNDTALFLSYLIGKHEYNKIKETIKIINDENFGQLECFYSITESIQEECNIGYKTQKRIRGYLVDAGFLIEKKAGLPAKNYFNVRFDNIALFLNNPKKYSNKKPEKQAMPKRKSLPTKKEKLVEPKGIINKEYSNKEYNKEDFFSKTKKIIEDAGSEILGNLPPEEKMIQGAILKAKKYFEEWPAMKETLPAQAKIRRDNQLFNFDEQLEKWIRHNGENLAIMTNPAKYIPAKFGGWLSNFNQFNFKPIKNGSTEKTNKHLVSRDTAIQALIELNEEDQE